MFGDNRPVAALHVFVLLDVILEVLLVAQCGRVCGAQQSMFHIWFASCYFVNFF